MISATTQRAQNAAGLDAKLLLRQRNALGRRKRRNKLVLQKRRRIIGRKGKKLQRIRRRKGEQQKC